MRELTGREQEALDASGRLANILAELPVLHDSDWSESARDIHNIQNRILSRPAYENQTRR